MNLNIEYITKYDSESVVKEINVPIYEDDNLLTIRFTEEALGDIVDLMNKFGLKATLEKN